MNDHGESIKDELQAYYGDEILVNNTELITNNNVTGSDEIEDDHILNIDFSQKDIDVDKIFNDILETKTIKELFLIRKELNKKIQNYQAEMQKFIHSNYKKLKFISNILDKNILCSNHTNCNDLSDLNSNKIINYVENNKNLVNEKFQEIKNNIFTNENNKNLEKYLTQYQLFTIVSELRNFHLILEDYFSMQDYESLIKMYNKWKKPLEILSNDDDFKIEFQEILRNSNEIFEKTINTLKKQILVNINKNSILPSINIIIKSYISLNSEQIDFTNDLISNINNLFRDIVNEIVIKQLENLEGSKVNDKVKIFSNTCKQSYQEIFIPLNFIISELNKDEIDPIIPSSILKNLFEVSFIKIIELLGHIFNYEKKNPKSELSMQPILQGFEYLNQSIKELLKTLSLTNFHKHPSFSSDKFKYIAINTKNNFENKNIEVDDDYYDINDNIIKRKYIEWKKYILSDFLKFENFDLSIKEIWNNLFDLVINLQNTDIETLFIEINKHLFNKLINDELYNIIKNYKELINIDFEICENLVRKVIKDFFQSIISNSILYINSVFFNNIKNSDLNFNSIENFDQLIEKMNLELEYSLNGNNIFDLNNQDWIVEKFSLVNYKQKAIYFLSIIILTRYLRDSALPACISYFYKCFYDDKSAIKNSIDSIEFLDLFNSDKIKYESPTNLKNNSFYEDDATMQIVRILYNRFEILFLNIFVIWNVHAIIQEIYDQNDLKSGEKIHIGKFIDFMHLNIIKLFKFCNILFQPQFQNSNYVRKSAISELQFPIKNSEKSQIFAKWSNNYYILKNFDLDCTKIVFNKPISFWFSQILHGIIIETIFIIKNNNFIIIENADSYEKSLSKFWNNIKNYFEYDIDFNITHALFCQLYNTLLLLNL
ncbi:unnamed protein product [Cryptosporidium hominis]|uniref:Uncharacterized protein n=2 Tax=Cryptosporidium hominis TaxID=237895 RepID=A0A0S4TEM4_CRYHO|nr:hypothetical protein ChTU502y2012_380g0020 [Cryptosporidium hominis]PPA63288.1 Vps51/Vps67 family protein [Cryptosporidium hominis]PPS92628.1 hypothetical protein GY17_00003363 [Cryptosporidium hominis]CUV05844.1 unnamed protein product [Cryptosporidium hominis]|eukprot:PPS92628.1 hypothetical protein GY17_00003363 [Cryptosporidium hominis]